MDAILKIDRVTILVDMPPTLTLEILLFLPEGVP